MNVETAAPADAKKETTAPSSETSVSTPPPLPPMPFQPNTATEISTEKEDPQETKLPSSPSVPTLSLASIKIEVASPESPIIAGLSSPLSADATKLVSKKKDGSRPSSARTKSSESNHDLGSPTGLSLNGMSKSKRYANVKSRLYDHFNKKDEKPQEEHQPKTIKVKHAGVRPGLKLFIKTDALADPKYSECVTPPSPSVKTPQIDTEHAIHEQLEFEAKVEEQEIHQVQEEIHKPASSFSPPTSPKSSSPSPQSPLHTDSLAPPGPEEEALRDHVRTRSRILSRRSSQLRINTLLNEDLTHATGTPRLPSPRRATAQVDSPKSAHLDKDNSRRATGKDPLRARMNESPPVSGHINDFKDSEDLKKKRDHVLQEILSTENTYVNEFKVLVEEYLTPIAEQNLVPKSSRQTLDNSLQAARSMLALHYRFQNDLQNAFPHILPVFIEYVEYMKNYFAYVQNFPLLLRDMQGEDLNKNLKKFLERATKEKNHNSMAQLLILPIQRIPRYMLLLERLEKDTPELHPDIQLTRLALAKMRIVAERVDECQKQSENSAVLFEFQKNVKGTPDGFRILSPTRIFIQEFICTDLTSNPNQFSTMIHPPKHPHKGSVRFILFNDLILITDYKYMYKTHLETLGIAVAPRLEAAFDVLTGIHHTELSAVLLCEDSAERDKWVKLVTDAADKQLQQLNQFYKRRKGLGQENKAAPSTISKVTTLEQVNLFLRVRPFVTQEEKDTGLVCLEVDDNIAVLSVEEKDKKWEKVGVYDDVFDQNTSQAQVFERSGQEILGALFAGYNSCIFAYGNTGAGKTYTMFGDVHNPERKGLVPRMLECLFNVLDTPNVYEKSQVALSYVQVYNNELQDLQAEDPTANLEIKKDAQKTKIKGLIRTPIKNCDEAMSIVDEGNKQRITRSHRMNEMSSRSHAVLIIEMMTKRLNEENPVIVQLYLIDLAGSENAKETGATGDALVECKHINQSLTALGRVINALIENKEKAKKQPVPFRESKLTHLLSDILSGDFACSIVLNASPSPVFEQALLTAKTMAFGAGVKKLALHAKQQKSEDSGVKHWLVGVWKSVARV